MSSVAFMTLSHGASFGWIAPAIVYLTNEEHDFQLTKTDISWIASVYYAMKLTAPAIAGKLSNKIGRKPLLTTSAFFMTLSWIITALAKSSIMLIIARSFLGMAAGILEIIWSMYLG